MARRGRGEGTIRRRASDGRWEAIATLGDQRKSFYGKTRAEAREKLAQARRAHEQGLFVGDQRQTVEQYLEGWLEAKRPPEVKESTWLQYVSRIRTHIIPVIGQVKLARLSPQHVQQVIATAQARGIASSTLGEVHGMLHRALASAVRLELLPRNIVDVVPRPKAATREMRPFTREEAQQFIAAVAEHRFSALFNLAISTGMRQGELLGLRWREVDLEAERLSVVASMHWRNVQPVYTEPKSRRSRRQIALSPTMVGKLREHRHRQRLERVAAGPAWQGDVYDAVFTDEVGLPLTDWTVRHHFKLVLARAGLPPLRFHDLRHTCATLLLAQRVNPKVVSEMLGHSTVAITLDLYSHVVPDMQHEAARAMSTALGW